MSGNTCMKLESIDPETFSLRVRCDGMDSGALLGRLSSLIMASADCGVSSIVLTLPDSIPSAVLNAVREVVRRSPIVRLVVEEARTEPHVKSESGIVGHDWSFICFRHHQGDSHYSVFISALESNVDRASRCADMLVSILGFSSRTSFEVRILVYELLMNVVEHGVARNPEEWVQVNLEKKGDKLVISVIDEGTAFNPSGPAHFDRDEYIADGKRRGLGLIMTRRIADQLSYERNLGYNRVMFGKSVSLPETEEYIGKEGTMVQFVAGELRKCGDGSHSIKLSGDLDAKGSLIMERLLSELLEKGIVRLTLDFAEVQFISSSGVGILLGIASSLREAGGDVVFMNVSHKVRSVFQLLNIEDYFNIKDSAESAV